MKCDDQAAVEELVSQGKDVTRNDDVGQVSKIKSGTLDVENPITDVVLTLIETERDKTMKGL